MLRELLTLLAKGPRAKGAVSRASMAGALGVSPSQIEEMLASLIKLGYVEDAARSCPDPAACSDSSSPKSACASCGLCGPGVFTDSRARLWQLSEKGRAAIESGNPDIAKY